MRISDWRSDVCSSDLFAPKLDALILVPAYLPPFVGAIAWIVLLSPEVGYINLMFRSVGLPTFNIYSYGGIIWVMGLYYAPMAYLYLRPALIGIDKSLEECARVMGATPGVTLRRIVIPLTLPALLSACLIIFVNAIGDFGIPGVLCYRAGIEVITTARSEERRVGKECVRPGRSRCAQYHSKKK